MSLPFNIAIDGHSSCGKSTIAQSIAKRYGMLYIDTGAMYRAVTLYCMQNEIIKINKLNIDLLKSHLKNISINFQFNLVNGESETILNGKNVEPFIRSIAVSDNVSSIAQVKEVRNKLIALQKEIGKNNNVVMDGRDIGTKVFPNARLKLFITASVEIRAKRRYDELVNKEDDISFNKILQNLNQRDKNDIKRKINPLIMAKDAVLIDNSFMTIQDQNIKISELIEKIL
tara:strand:+ start:158 stop:844 length:687 start_codon:yes stop_codon:yes gene_type:complete